MALDRWAGKFEEWGNRLESWGVEIPQFVSDAALAAYAISLEYPDDTAFHIWTGFDDLTLGGISYTAVGPDVIEVGAAQAAATGQGRMAVTLSAVQPEHRVKFLQDPGLVMVTVRLLYSADGGATWIAMPRFHRGELSRPQLQGGKYSIEISPYRDTLDRGYEQNWSDANQQKDYPDDLGFQHLKSLTDGIDLRWP